MSLFNTLNTGASGLGVNSTALSVIGDNIANSQTTGFKSGSATFADMIPGEVQGLGGPSALGRGAQVSRVASTFAQGSINQSSSALDMALNGPGFFAVNNGNERFYTRDGSFRMDKDNFIVNANGLRLQGYQATAGVLSTAIGDLQLDTRDIAASATTEITLAATLSAEADFSTTPLAALAMDGTLAGGTLEDASNAADYATSVTVYDSRGNAHDATIFFERSDVNTYAYRVAVDAGELDPAGVAGTAFQVGSGTATFGTDGTLTASTGPAPLTGTFPGADPINFTLDITTNGSLRMAGSDSYTTEIAQDGYTNGSFAGLRVENDGTIMAAYTNGEELTVGQVAVATFPAEDQLERIGGNLFRDGPNTGEPALGAAGSGGRGEVNGYALEGSNVELEDEFVAMIRAQRSYQANTSVITTVNQTLQELVKLV